jgi:hypothetical protein
LESGKQIELEKARMPVLKMVKNGFSSSFVLWGQF